MNWKIPSSSFWWAAEFVFAVAFISSTAAPEVRAQKAAQPPNACGQEIADKITLRGFRLGTSPDDYFHIPGFKAAYEKSKAPDPEIDIFRTRDLGLAVVHSWDPYFEEIQATPELKELIGDVSFSLHFYDAKLSTIIISYKEFETPNLLDFQKQINQTLGLPTNGWVREHLGAASMNCGDVEITIRTGRIPGKSWYRDWPSIWIESQSLAREFDRKFEERKKAEELAKKKAEEEALEKKRQEEMRRRTLRP
ncbi:MAG: hypothetical protein KF831_10245 [Acidobacteria bacterium]|nr:hypothetical protein [Acidobacteriota bacterium]